MSKTYRISRLKPLKRLSETYTDKLARRKNPDLIVLSGLSIERPQPHQSTHTEEVSWRGVFGLFLIFVTVVTSIYYFRKIISSTPSSFLSQVDASTIFTGTIRPSAETKIAASSQALVKELHVKVGDRVSEGQLLLSLDDTEAQSALRQAELEQRAAQTQIAELTSAITSHQKQLAALRSELAKAGGKVSVAQRRAEQVPLRQRQDSPERAQAIYEQAQARLRRAEDLRSRGLMSEQEYESARAEMKIAEADLESAKRAAAASNELARAQEHQAQLQASLEINEQNRLLTEMQSQLEQARLRLLRADEALKAAQRRLSETQIRSTTSAVIVDIPFRSGDLVASGMILVRLANLDSLIIDVPVGSRVVNSLTKGQRVLVTLPIDRQQIEGRILTINPIPSENLNHTVEVIVDNSSGRLLVGQSAEVQFIR